MLNLVYREDTWEPGDFDWKAIYKAVMDFSKAKGNESLSEALVITKVQPYIEAVYVCYEHTESANLRQPILMHPLIIHEGYSWLSSEEELFCLRCLKGCSVQTSYASMDEIYKYYQAVHPEWQLKRYYTKPMRLLDHIYHCMQRDTLKEKLYKAGLDELAVASDRIDEVDLLASKVTEYYEGLSMRSLRALNCEAGANMLCERKYRKFLLKLQQHFPDVFAEKMTDAQCLYLRYMIDGDLTDAEAGRLYLARRKELMMIWGRSQYALFLQKEHLMEFGTREERIDPIFENFRRKYERNPAQHRDTMAKLKLYLGVGREEYDRLIRRSNRKRDPEWQERTNGYVVRFPQTANDFCREAVYMCNCLMSYMEAFSNNDTTILFIRQESDVNMPFITMEVYNNILIQAFHRFNTPCTPEELAWIKEYCLRHGIDGSKFTEDGEIPYLI